MPPKAAALPPQQAQTPLQDTLEYLLPQQLEQYRQNYQKLNDLQSRKAKDPDNKAVDAAISETRKQLAQLDQQVAKQKKVFPTLDLLKGFVTKVQQQLAALSRQNTAQLAQTAASSAENLKKLQVKIIQFANRLTEIENAIGGPDLNEDARTKLRTDYQTITPQLEHAREILRLATTQKQSRPAGPGNMLGGQAESSNVSQQAPAPSQSATPPISQPPTPRNIAAQPSISQPIPTPTPTATLGAIPRPVVNPVIQPVRPTLSGGFSVGNPLLGATTPAGPPNAFQVQDGETRLLSKRKLQDLARSIDPDERLEPDVEDVSSLSLLCLWT